MSQPKRVDVSLLSCQERECLIESYVQLIKNYLQSKAGSEQTFEKILSLIPPEEIEICQYIRETQILVKASVEFSKIPM